MTSRPKFTLLYCCSKSCVSRKERDKVVSTVAPCGIISQSEQVCNGSLPAVFSGLQVTGVVEDREGTAHYILSGTWDDKMENAKIVDSSQGCGGSECKQKMVYQTLPPKLLWKKYPLPYVCATETTYPSALHILSWVIFGCLAALLTVLCPSLHRDNAENMYFFSSLALTLNESEEGIAPTDSRMRPDQRLMEAGLWDEANVQKQRLEECQRLERKRREAQATQALEEGEAEEPVASSAFVDICSEIIILGFKSYLTLH